jgi:hypothetical protein
MLSGVIIYAPSLLGIVMTSCIHRLFSFCPCHDVMCPSISSCVLHTCHLLCSGIFFLLLVLSILIIYVLYSRHVCSRVFSSTFFLSFRSYIYIPVFWNNKHTVVKKNFFFWLTIGKWFDYLTIINKEIHLLLYKFPLTVNVCRWWKMLIIIRCSKWEWRTKDR